MGRKPRPRPVTYPPVVTITEPVQSSTVVPGSIFIVKGTVVN